VIFHDFPIRIADNTPAETLAANLSLLVGLTNEK
jgi:hypothetical protein